MFSKAKSLLVVFIVGICITALEIASARLISPYFGSTIYVWGGAIGSVLFALSVGYWLGGKIIDTKPEPRVISWVLILAGTTTLLIPWMYQTTTYALSHWSALKHIPVSVGVILSMIVLFFLPVLAMGMISPMVLRLSAKSVNNVGSWSGLLSGVATFGSIVGTFGAAYGTIPVLGTRWTIMMSAVLIYILSMIVSLPPKKVSMAMVLGVLVTGGLIIQTTFIPRPGLAAEKESAYQLIQVLEQNGTRFLVHDAGRGAQSIYTPGEFYTKSAYDVFGLLPYLAGGQEKKRSVLLLGLGGGNMVKIYKQLLEPEFSFDITAVEIDAAVVATAKEYFAIDEVEFTTVVDDARHYLRSSDKKYDIIIADAYTHETQIPAMLATTEFFSQIREHLNTGGVLGINALAFQESRFLPKFLATIAAVFPDVRETPFIPGSLNHFIVAGEKIDLSRVPVKMQEVVEPYRDLALVHLQQVTAGGDVYTDDRTDLDLRVRPFLE